MTDPTHLDQVLTVLRRHGVEQFRDGELAIVLGPAPLPAAGADETTATLPASSTAALPDDDEPSWDDTV